MDQLLARAERQTRGGGRAGGLVGVGVVLLVPLWAGAEVVLMDQIGAGSADFGGMTRSQKHEAAHAEADLAVCDDFAIPASAGRQKLTVAEAVISFYDMGSPRFDLVQHYGVYVSPTLAGISQELRDEGAAAIVAGDAVTVKAPYFASSYFRNGRVTIDLKAFDIWLDPGTYYLAVVPRIDWGDGWTFVMDSHVGDTTGLYAMSAYSQTPAVQIIGAGAAYRLVAVPEPVNVGGLMVGVAMAAGRRRRGGAAGGSGWAGKGRRGTAEL